MKVVFGGQINRPPVLSALREFPGIELVEVDEVQHATDYVRWADVLVIPNPPHDQGAKLAVALSAPGRTVRWVQIISAGIDGLASHPLPRDLVLTNQGGAAAPAVAEHAMMLLMALYRRLDVALASQSRAQWSGEKMRMLTRSIEGTSVGVVGMGHIGREFALRVRAFGATVHGFSRNGGANDAVHQMHKLADLQVHLPDLDSVVLCLALAPGTRQMFDSALFAKCKKGAVLVNVARGEIVDAAALEAALRCGWLGGAALDVTDPEPLPPRAGLWTAPNVILTPHIAATGNKQVGDRIAAVVKDNVRRFMAGEPLQHIVNP